MCEAIIAVGHENVKIAVGGGVLETRSEYIYLYLFEFQL